MTVKLKGEKPKNIQGRNCEADPKLPGAGLHQSKQVELTFAIGQYQATYSVRCASELYGHNLLRQALHECYEMVADAHEPVASITLHASDRSSIIYVDTYERCHDWLGDALVGFSVKEAMLCLHQAPWYQQRFSEIKT